MCKCAYFAKLMIFVSDTQHLAYGTGFRSYGVFSIVSGQGTWSLLYWNKYVLNPDLVFTYEKWLYEEDLDWFEFFFFLLWDNTLALVQCSCYSMASYYSIKPKHDWLGLSRRMIGIFSWVICGDRNTFNYTSMSGTSISFLFNSNIFVCSESYAFKNIFFELWN